MATSKIAAPAKKAAAVKKSAPVRHKSADPAKPAPVKKGLGKSDHPDNIDLDRLVEVSQEHLRRRIDGTTPGPKGSIVKLPGTLRQAIIDQVNDGKVNTELDGGKLEQHLLKQIPDLD